MIVDGRPFVMLETGWGSVGIESVHSRGIHACMPSQKKRARLHSNRRNPNGIALAFASQTKTPAPSLSRTAPF